MIIKGIAGLEHPDIDPLFPSDPSDNTLSDALPSSLIDSNASLKWKQRKSKESGHAP
jgi:hypothetical protein